MINKSFQLLRTNPALTTNIKLVVNADYKLYLESFDTNKQLSDQKFKHFSISKNHLYEDQLIRFYDGLSSQLAFDVKYDTDNTNVFPTYNKQFDDIYWSGAKAVEDNWYKEDYEYLAPLFIRKGNLPEGFIVLRVDDATPYAEINNQFGSSKLNKDNFFTQVVDKFKCVNFFDMRYQSDFGYFLYNNFDYNTRFPEKSFELDFRQYEYSKFYGIDYLNGVYVTKSKFLQDILYYEQPHFKLEKEILNSFRSNNLVYPHILNLKFLFNDVPASPDNVNNYSINRYYGFYVDKLEFITNLTSYITPEIKSGYTLQNNIFMYNGTESDSPFVEGWYPDKTYWVQYENEFYQVVRVFKDNKYVFQIISTFDMSGLTFTTVNDRTCFINYEAGTNYTCRTILNPSGYTNFISGFTPNFKIDPYYKDGVTETMFADLYIINIDGIFHVVKKRDNNYFIQSDYAINSFPESLQYWKGGIYSKYYKIKPVYQYGVKPLSYPVYRIKFSDIKDFDFDRVNTHFSDFDYEQDTYNVTNEHKLYAVDYSDMAVLNKSFMVHPRGEDGQYQIMNVSSEYAADDELYEISFNDLTDIWRKNQSVVKWGFAGSNSNCDYPYKLNNSIDVGDVFNRTSDILSSAPLEIDKNLDYFYRIGNFFSGNTILRYLNQSTNIEVDLLEYGKKFNLDLYLKSEVDYFDYFFKNKEYFNIFTACHDNVEYIKPTLKYSTFQAGDKYIPSSTFFKGLNINLLSVDSISRDSSGKILSVITNNKTFNNYKFSIILNDVYDYYDGTSYVGLSENGLTDNLAIDKSVNGIHVFLNDKYKNILVVINVKIPIQQNLINFNNVPIFGEKYGLYNSKTLTEESLIYPATVSKEYNPALITASNFIDCFDDMNTLSEFESGVTYYYINSVGQSGTTGPINIFNPNNTMKNIPDWGKLDPPIILTMNNPSLIETKKQSYLKSAIKGPLTNIYDKYQVFYDQEQRQKYNITEPLGRSMSLNIEENNLNTVYASNAVYTPNQIFRYNGTYEPIFSNIPIFNNTYLYTTELTPTTTTTTTTISCLLQIDSVSCLTTTTTTIIAVCSIQINSISCITTTTTTLPPTTTTTTTIKSVYKQWDSNYKFDTSFENFGVVEEIIYSKVNPIISPLKLKDTDKDKSIYPMVDEYGYQFSSRFIFNSSWDKDFYVITNSDQNVNKQIFSNLSNVEHIVDPIKPKII